jgi:ribonuclease R
MNTNDILRNHILHLLEKDGTPRKRARLQCELGIASDLQWAFDEALDGLYQEGRIIVSPDSLVRLPSLAQELTGIFKANARGYGFVSPEQGPEQDDLFVPGKATLSAMSGDRVVARLKRSIGQDGQSRLTGKIVEILERAHTQVVGVLQADRDQWLVQPDGGDFCHPIEVEHLDHPGLRQGDKVQVHIRSYPHGNRLARGVISKCLGHRGHYDTETAAVMQRYHLTDTFDPSSLVEANNAKMGFTPQTAHDREDRTGDLIITIDPPDAQDFDDAISLRRTRRGAWILGVHIADVSHFVKEGSALDAGARARGNSVYLPGKTLPMLPEMLSNGVCSLQPHALRFTKSVYLTYNKDATLRSTHVANTVIQSKARLSYQQAARLLKGKPDPDVPQEVVTLLRRMDHLARTIEKRRQQAGMLQLNLPVTELVRDDSGQIIEVQPADTSYPHTLIEMFMVEANVAVATLLDRHCVPIMRRIHPAPNQTALRRLSDILGLLGVTLSRQPSRFELQSLLNRIRNTGNELPVHLLILRSLAKATYAPANIGHYALAASKYCHFTSPIRRYADLLVHRALDDYLTGNLDHARQHAAFAEIADIGTHISDTEQNADEATQELRTILTLHLVNRHVGEELPGVIVNLTPFGAFVHLPDYGVEGMIPIEALGPDQWQFDERSQCLVGRHSGAVWRLAQRLRVRIVSVHPAAGQLDLAPSHAPITRASSKKQSTNRHTTTKKQKRNRRKHKPEPLGTKGLLKNKFPV